MKKLIPNFFTFLNLLLGICGIAMLIAMETRDPKCEMLYTVSIFIFAAAICDFLDGFFAKLLNAHSAIGKELDSFADLITFGVLPSFIMFKLLDISKLHDSLLIFIPLIMPCFTAYRLARFSTINSKDFIGLSSTATGMLVASMPLIQKFSEHNWIHNVILQPEILIFITIALCILMVCKLKFLSLKLNSLRWNDNKILFSIMVLSICLIFIFKVDGIFFSFCVYIFGSIFSNIYK